MTFLIIDTETGGLDPETDPLLEVGAVLFDADLGVPIESRSLLVRADSNGAESINGIPEAAVRLWGVEPSVVEQELSMLCRAASETGSHYVLAHNAAFDRQWLPCLKNEPWICTYEADWPRMTRGLPAAGSGSLHAIALAYGVGIVRAHRAIEDVLTLAAVLSRVHEIEGGLDGWIARATEERVELAAVVSYDDRQLAKDAGFQWDPSRKLWVRKVRVSQVEMFTETLPFRTRAA